MISNQSGSLDIYGGTFHGIPAERGGILYMTSGKLNIEGGTFYPGKGTTAGEGIYLNGSGVVATISGEPVIYGGFYAYSISSLTISGKPVIEKVKGGSAYSLKLADSVKLTVGTMEEGARIAVNAADGAFTVEFADEAAATAAAAYFAADDAAKAVAAEGKFLVIAAKPAA